MRCAKGAERWNQRQSEVLAGRQIIVENYSGSYFINDFFIAASHSAKSAVDHSTVGKSGCEAFIEAFYRHFRHFFAQLPKKRINETGALRWGSIHLLRKPHYDFIYRLPATVILQKSQEIARPDSLKAVGTNAQSVGHSYTAPLPSVINC